jgi:hypothetical protein
VDEVVDKISGMLYDVGFNLFGKVVRTYVGKSTNIRKTGSSIQIVVMPSVYSRMREMHLHTQKLM